VRSAVVWLGLPDPGETRLLLQKQADVAAESMGVLLQAWEQMDLERRGLTAAEVVQLLKEPPKNPPDYYADLRDAIEVLVGKLDARSLGNRLRSYRRRLFDGRFIDQAGTQKRAARWAVYPASAFGRRPRDTHQTRQTHPTGGECGESGECSPSPAGNAKSAGSPTPPPDAQLYYQDENGHVCNPATAHLWTWQGADRWYRAGEHAPPGR
jgi:hypothetical protein